MSNQLERLAVQDWARKNRYGRDTVNCTICAQLAASPATQLCDRCWELKTRIQRDPDIAGLVIERLLVEESGFHFAFNVIHDYVSGRMVQDAPTRGIKPRVTRFEFAHGRGTLK